MRVYYIEDYTAQERFKCSKLSTAKSMLKERIKMGHEVSSSIIQIWANGDWETLGPIKLTTNNKILVANSKQKKPGY